MDERRDELLAAARLAFVERPYDEVSLDDIAARAHASKALVYHYFHGKRGLYIETLREASRELVRATEPDPEWPPEVRLRRGLEAYLDYAEAAGPGYVALLRGGVGADPEVFGIVEETRQQIVARALESLGLAQVSPVLELAMRAWIGFVEAASVEYLRRRDVPREALLDLMARTAVAAIESTLGDA